MPGTPCLPIAPHETGEARGAFGGFIGPRTLLAQVWNTAPWLLAGCATDGEDRPLDARAAGPFGWRDILVHGERLSACEAPDEAQWVEYFALCVAAHFGTCATHVPTDVDTKIREHLWWRLSSEDALARALDLAEQLATWDIRPVSARTLTFPDVGVISGHDGERLSVLAGGLLRAWDAGHAKGAARMEAAIDAEVRREAALWLQLAKARGGQRTLALVSGNLTHNAGDLDQGLSAAEGRRVAGPAKARWGRLAHERFDRHGGVFRKASAINQAVMAPEAHRHYPLRKIPLLREDPRWLRPPGPFLDAWGEALGRHEGWDVETRGTLLDGLLQADKRVPGQEAYGRALAGLDRTLPGGIDHTRYRGRLSTAARKHLGSKALRTRVAVSQASFEAQMAKRVRQALGR